jgi:hypothetical protein
MSQDSKEPDLFLDLITKLMLKSNNSNGDEIQQLVVGNIIKLQDARLKITICPTIDSIYSYPEIKNNIYVYAKNDREAKSIIAMQQAMGFDAFSVYVN